MFEYDRLVLNVAEQIFKTPPSKSDDDDKETDAYYDSTGDQLNFDFDGIDSFLDKYCSNFEQQHQAFDEHIFPSPKNNSIDDSNRRLSGGSNSYGCECIFDCGASSGYGSPGAGGTPLPSPAPISALTAPAAIEDGFSPTEIAQFAQLLCSPKKAPPQRYMCHICYRNGHYISDCPMRFNSPYEELTPYQGRKKCYGEFQCQFCKRKWISQNSVANEAQSCIKCHVPVFPHKQLPVDKAIALGLVKSQRAASTKLTPIGQERSPVGLSPAANGNCIANPCVALTNTNL